MSIRFTRRTILAVLSAVALSSTTSASAGDWPHWRGPNYDGHSNETGFKTSWDGELTPVWSKDIGAGYSGIAVANGRLFTCGVRDGKQVLFCFDANGGSEKWAVGFEKLYENNWGDGSRSTPTVDADRVYVLGALGTVGCYKVADGSTVWTRKYDAVPQWGYSGSVLIEGDKAIITVGGSGGGMKALNKQTGEPIWANGGDSDSGYSTPYPFTFEGTRYVVGFLGGSAVIAHADTGKEAATIPWETDWKVNAATPIYHDGHLFLSSGYSTGCGLFKLSKDGDRLETKEVYTSKKLKNKFQTPVLYRGKLFSFDQRSLKCVDFDSGDIEWEKRGKANQHGTIVFADKHLITLNQQGVLKIARASPKAFEPTGTTTVFEQRGGRGEQCWTVPTLANGRLYLRNLKRLVCIDLRQNDRID